MSMPLATFSPFFLSERFFGRHFLLSRRQNSRFGHCEGRKRNARSANFDDAKEESGVQRNARTKRTAKTLLEALTSSPPQAARIPTASRFVFPRRLRWVPPTTALLQRRTTKRLYFWAARP